MPGAESEPVEQEGEFARQRTPTEASNRRHSEPRKRTGLKDALDRRVRSLSPRWNNVGGGPRRRAQQFAQRFVKEAAQTPLVHFPEGKLAPPPDEGKDAARDAHDLGNLLVLPVLLLIDANFLYHGTTQAWWLFFLTVLVYFIGDLTWVVLVPECVKSTLTIKMHHSVSIFYLVLPFTYPEFGHFLGYCMLVELNTWFLIARRYWRRSSKIFSIGFYITWVTVRVGLFTYLMINSFEAYLEKVFPQLDANNSGTLTRKEIMRLRNWVHLMMLAPIFQTIFCALNWKWTYDLILQKVKGAGPAKGL